MRVTHPCGCVSDRLGNRFFHVCGRHLGEIGEEKIEHPAVTKKSADVQQACRLSIEEARKILKTHVNEPEVPIRRGALAWLLSMAEMYEREEYGEPEEKSPESGGFIAFRKGAEER